MRLSLRKCFKQLQLKGSNVPHLFSDTTMQSKVFVIHKWWTLGWHFNALFTASEPFEVFPCNAPEGTGRVIRFVKKSCPIFAHLIFQNSFCSWGLKHLQVRKYLPAKNKSGIKATQNDGKLPISLNFCHLAERTFFGWDKFQQSSTVLRFKQVKLENSNFQQFDPIIQFDYFETRRNSRHVAVKTSQNWIMFQRGYA